MSFSAPLATSREGSGIPTGRLAMWWVLASEIVIFGGLLMCYVILRLNNEYWGAEASHTSTAAGGFNTFVLLTSSLFAVLAHQAAEKGHGYTAWHYLKLTIGGGLIFLCVKAYEYTHEITAGFTMFRDVFWSFYYTATGLHGLHVIAGMIAMFLIGRQARDGKNLHRVEYVGIYWHFVDAVWIFLFPLLYIAK